LYDLSILGLAHEGRDSQFICVLSAEFLGDVWNAIKEHPGAALILISFFDDTYHAH